MATRPQASRAEKTQLLGEQVEQLVVESQRLGIDFEDLQEAVDKHWKRLKTAQRDGRVKVDLNNIALQDLVRFEDEVASTQIQMIR